MVCESCQSKVKALVVSDKWKDGARSTSSTGASKGVMKTNKALVGKFKPETISVKLCRICKSKTQGVNNFCNDCAHKKGLCSICGKKVVDTSKHNMSLV